MPELDRSCATRPRRGKEDRCYRPEGIDGVQLDALRRGKTRIKQGPRNVVLDHCSIAWATDEMIGAGSAYDLTVQWSLVSEGLDYMHYGGAKSRNGKGMLIGNEFYAKRGDVIGHASIHHNLWAHNSIRSPQATNYCPDPTQPEDCVVDLVNNYVYDWKRMGMHIANSHGASFANVVGNLFRAGPSTHKKSMGLGMRDWTSTSTGLNPGSRIEIHQEDNQDLVRGDKTRPARTECYELGGAKNGRQKVLGACDMASYAAERFDAPAVTTWPARELPERLLDSVGATQHLDAEGRWVPARDAADARVIEQVRRGWGKVLSKPADWKGWPRMPANPPPRDADDDGMPDAWEILHGLDPAKASDTLDRDGDVYTDLEEFLNGTDPNVAEAG
jgi:hypothetical protein